MTTQATGASEPAARQDSENLHANAVELTAAEQAALDEAKAEATPAATPAKTDAPLDAAATPAADASAATPAATPGKDAPADDAAAAAAAATPTPTPAAEVDPATPAAPAQRGVFSPNLSSNAPKDFDAEDKKISDALVDINRKSSAGEMDDDEWEREEARLREDQRKLDRERTRWETKQELAGEMAAQTWTQNRDLFLRQPENAFISRDEATATAWASMMQMAVNEAAVAGKPLGADWDILEAGATKLRELMGIKPGAAAAAAATPAAPTPNADAVPPKRDPKLDTVPNTLGGAPAAGNLSARTTADELAGSSIQDIEAHFARQTDDARDALLRSVPGAFADG